MGIFLLLKQDSLSLFTKDSQPQKLAFPAEIVNHQEIIDQKAFEELLRGVLMHLAKQEVLLFLSNELIFTKSTPLKKETVIEDELKKFGDIVPISSNSIEKKVIHTQSTISFLATNGDLYKTIVSVAQEKGCQITKVIPLVLFGPIPEKQPLSYDLLSQFAKEKTILEKGDFLQEDEQKKEKKPTQVKQVFMLLISLLCLAGAVFWAASSMGFLAPQKSLEKKSTTVISPSPKTTTAPTASKAAETTSSPKGNIKIQILNGSGVVGQASKIKDELTSLGFTNIQTGNAEGPIANTTIVVFSKEVSKADQNAIVIELKKTFNNIDTQQIPSSNAYDVSITTGEVK